MKSKPSEPTWILTEDWGIGIDPLNWRLYARTKSKKTGESNGWRIAGYFPKLKYLVARMHELTMLTKTESGDVPKHIEMALASFEKATRSLKSQLNTIGAGLDTLPPKYAIYETKERKAA